MTGAVLGAALVTTVLLISVLRIQPLRQDHSVWMTMVTLICLLWLGLLGMTVYRKLSRHYQLTTQRLIHRKGIVFRQVEPIELLDVNDVSYRQSQLGTLMNVGNLQLETSDPKTPTLTLPGIGQIKHVVDLIEHNRLAARKTHGVHLD